MGKLRYSVAIFLDGFITPPNESVGRVVNDGIINFAVVFAEFEIFIMDRKTYNFMLSEGDKNPFQDKPGADHYAKDELGLVQSPRERDYDVQI